MSDEEKTAGDQATATATADEPADQPLSDEHTTEPHAPALIEKETAQAAGGKWQMPKPKFQQTSGYLPQGYLKDIQQAPARSSPGSEDTTQEQAPYIPLPPPQQSSDPALLPDIEPQPFLDEVILDEATVETAGSQPTVKNSSGFLRAIVGLIAILIFLGVFLVAVYYFFFIWGQ